MFFPLCISDRRPSDTSSCNVTLTVNSPKQRPTIVLVRLEFSRVRFPPFLRSRSRCLKREPKKIKEVFSLLSWCGFLAGIKLEISSVPFTARRDKDSIPESRHRLTRERRNNRDAFERDFFQMLALLLHTIRSKPIQKSSSHAPNAAPWCQRQETAGKIAAHGRSASRAPRQQPKRSHQSIQTFW